MGLMDMRHIIRLWVFLLAAAFLLTMPAAAEEEPTQHTIGLEDFAHARIGVEAETTDSYLSQQLFPEAKILGFNNASDVALALASNKIDAFVVSDFVADKLCQQYPGFRKLTSFQFEYYGVAFPQTRKGARLQEEFNQYLKDIRADGTMSELYSIWMEPREDYPFLPLEKLPAPSGVLRMAADNVYEPFVFMYHGKPVGFDVDLVYRFCQRYGYGLQVNAMNFDSIIASVNTGNCDLAVSGISITEERKEKLLFSDPYFTDSTCLVYSEDSNVLPTSLADSFRKTFLRESRWQQILNGMRITLLITVLSILFGTVLGFLIYLIRRLGRAARFVTGIYIKVFQGTPQLVLLMFFYYVVFARSHISSLTVAVFAFTLIFAAYAAELFEAGISAVDPGQLEAALSLGYTRRQSYLYYVFPQAAEHFLPVYRGEVVSLLKNTSIVGYIAIQDLTKVGDAIRARTYEAFFPLITVAVLYFLLSYLLILLVRRIELRMVPNRLHRTVKGVKLRD